MRGATMRGAAVLIVAASATRGVAALTEIEQTFALGGIVGTLFAYALVASYVLVCVRGRRVAR